MGIDAALWVVLLKIKETAFQRSNISFSLTYRERYLFWSINCLHMHCHRVRALNKIQQQQKLRTIIPLIEALNGMKSHHLSHATSGRFNEIVLKNLEKNNSPTFSKFDDIIFFLSRKWFYFFMLKLENEIS